MVCFLFPIHRYAHLDSSSRVNTSQHINQALDTSSRFASQPRQFGVLNWLSSCYHCSFMSNQSRTHYIIMTSSNGNIFRVTGHLCGEFTGHRWIPRTKASDAELWCFFDLRLNKRLSKQWCGWWFETSLCSLWRHGNDPAKWCICSRPVFCLLLGVSSDYAQSITDQFTKVTCPVIGTHSLNLLPAGDRKRALVRSDLIWCLKRYHEYNAGYIPISKGDLLLI